MEQTTPLPESQEEPPAAPPTSLAGRLLNVFACPGDVFEQVKATPSSVANWLLPSVLLSIIGVIFCILVFSQPAIVQSVKEQQEKKMDELVKAGKMKQEDAEKAEQFTGATTIKLFTSVTLVIVSFGRVFWWALVLMLLGRWFLHARFGYGKALEVSGLTMMISLLGVIVAMLLIVKFERLSATPGLGFFISDFDINRKSHLFAGAANVFSIWQVCVLAIGLSRLAAVRYTKAALVVFIYWILQESILIECGMGQLAQ